MATQARRIESILDKKGVKRHVFEPSGREMWTVVGRGTEHWLDPDMGYCSCPGFYFGRMMRAGRTAGRGPECSHLQAARIARRSGRVEVVRFADSEYDDFIAGLAGQD